MLKEGRLRLFNATTPSVFDHVEAAEARQRAEERAKAGGRTRRAGRRTRRRKLPPVRRLKRELHRLRCVLARQQREG
jgi:hypothetical protein